MIRRLFERSRVDVFACCLLALVAAPRAQAQLHAALEQEDEPRTEQLDPPQPADAPQHMPAMDHAAMHAGHAPTQVPVSVSDHIAPPPPQHAMGVMSASDMVDAMGMDDDASFGMFTLDRFERVKSDDGYATAWSAEGWLGRDFDKLWFKSEGSHAQGAVAHADAQLLWSHALASYWDTQLGLRHDFGQGPQRSWIALGTQGLAPYWFELAATAYIGQQGRTALRIESSYDVRLTQRLIVQPRFELNAYGKADPALDIGAGLSDAEFGLRVRYEIHREFAPYVGIEWGRRFGASADLARAGGERVFDTQVVAGLRLWF
ncbi:MAG: copper resistance protein B [Dokdonella sp.]